MDLEAYLKMYRATTCTASTKLDLIFIVDAVAAWTAGLIGRFSYLTLAPTRRDATQWWPRCDTRFSYLT